MTDMDMPLPEAIMAPLNNIVEEAEANGNSMESDAWLPNNLLKIQDAIRAYAFPLTFSSDRSVPRPSMPPSTYISTSVSTSGGAGQPLTAAM